jgi:hypothetical protein
MNDFTNAARTARSSMHGELCHFLRESKKWWLLPILMVFGLFGLLTLLSSSAAAPFIYTLF